MPDGRGERVDLAGDVGSPVRATQSARSCFSFADRSAMAWSSSRPTAVAVSERLRSAPADSVTFFSAVRIDPVRGRACAAAVVRDSSAAAASAAARVSSRVARVSSRILSSSAIRVARLRARAVVPMYSASDFVWRPRWIPCRYAPSSATPTGPSDRSRDSRAMDSRIPRTRSSGTPVSCSTSRTSARVVPVGRSPAGRATRNCSDSTSGSASSTGAPSASSRFAACSAASIPAASAASARVGETDEPPQRRTGSRPSGTSGRVGDGGGASSCSAAMLLALGDHRGAVGGRAASTRAASPVGGLAACSATRPRDRVGGHPRAATAAVRRVGQRARTRSGPRRPRRGDRRGRRPPATQPPATTRSRGPPRPPPRPRPPPPSASSTAAPGRPVGRARRTRGHAR